MLCYTRAYAPRLVLLPEVNFELKPWGCLRSLSMYFQQGRSVLTANGHPAFFHPAMPSCPAVTGATSCQEIESEYDICE
jgi:hypothetical protein